MAHDSGAGSIRELTEASELAHFHDDWFDNAERIGGDVYGSPDDWPAVKRSGHTERMRFLEALDLGAVEDKVAVDFGTGPWGFACIFPKLRNARHCIALDVSQSALRISATRDTEIKGKTTYLPSDGDLIPLDDNTADIFWGGEVIEHVRNPRLFLQELSRVCKPNALVVLSTPNRDALYYYARGQDHSIGPEHIALMNYDELSNLLGLFFEEYTIHGYELSLAPELDSIPFSEDALSLLQARAAAFPRTASGFIVQAIASKSLYRLNKRSMVLDEFLWNSARVVGHEAAESLALFAPVTGGSISPQQPLSFSATGQSVILLFWAHSWSGLASIEVDGAAAKTVSLYSSDGGFKRVAFTFPDVRPHHFVIRRLQETPAGSNADQVIFYKTITYRYS